MAEGGLLRDLLGTESRKTLLEIMPSSLGISVLGVLWMLHMWSMLFACHFLNFFIFHCIPFLPGSPFRVFDPPGK
ncbi:hypothetical protein MtrunA17_Chr7g0226181 [Medicago truncatula]|uniref:Transmembrane protein n=1 Tax=Medicago truncatula TaxID=3880 RepID=A0A396GXW6_MEDTR|nr:hypothetical protein MtrunA17_Chr7g0226181 [Medicago truncatula]